MNQLTRIYQAILKNGISNERLSVEHKNNYGKIAVANSKALMVMNRGYTVGAVETLLTNTKSATHWTPNVYKYLKRTNGVVTGHEEHNLKQINTFVLDIDNPDISHTDILTVGFELDFIPSLILKTDKGFHVYFILEQPVYVSETTHFRSLTVAKYISKNIRELYASEIEGIDQTCNHFGYFRIPNESNVVRYQADCVYNFKTLMRWSQSYAEEKVIHFEAEQHMRQAAPDASVIKQIKEPWYRELISQAKIYPGQGYGRNNAMFTLSLANYQSYVGQSDCLNKMEYFNELLEYPLPLRDVERIVESAYSGKYKGATQQFVSALTQEWCGKAYTTSAFNRWVKKRKRRAERKHSHAYEREQDIIKYLNAHQRKGVVQASLRELAEHLNISVNALSNVLKQSKLIKRQTVGKGRAAITKFYTLQTLVQHVQKLKSQSIIPISEINRVMKLVPTSLRETVEDILREPPISPGGTAFQQLRLLE